MIFWLILWLCLILLVLWWTIPKLLKKGLLKKNRMEQIFRVLLRGKLFDFWGGGGWKIFKKIPAASQSKKKVWIASSEKKINFLRCFVIPIRGNPLAYVWHECYRLRWLNTVFDTSVSFTFSSKAHSCNDTHKLALVEDSPAYFEFPLLKFNFF